MVSIIEYLFAIVCPFVNGYLFAKFRHICTVWKSCMYSLEWAVSLLGSSILYQYKFK